MTPRNVSRETLATTRFIGGWTASRARDGAIPYTVTRNERTVKADAYEFRSQTHYSARPVWFPTRTEAQDWLDGKPTSTTAPSITAVVWAKAGNEAQAVQAWIDEYDMAPEYKRQ